MKTKPDFTGNILTKDLQSLPDGTLFYEHVFDGLEEEQPLYKKMRTCDPTKEYPDGDIIVQAMTCGQFGEVPGESNRLGWTNESGKEWRVMPRENVEKLVGWLMTTAQYFEG